VQQRQTYAREQEAEIARIDMEKARGTADAQADLAKAQVNVDIQKNRAAARTAEAEGESSYPRLTGQAQADRTKAIGLARAKAVEARGLAQAVGYDEQVKALGSGPTAIVAVTQAVSEGNVKVVPDVLVMGGGDSLDGLAATLMERLRPSTADDQKPRAERPRTRPSQTAHSKEEDQDGPEPGPLPPRPESLPGTTAKP
jgi:uncharacterized membrane protein YqiK